MDQIKIGNFIKERRKEKNITQEDLAEKLYITDRAISKWERGLCLPDAATMPLLCKILDITINDLFSGEKVDMKNNEKILEENLLTMTKLKEQKDKELLLLEIVIGIIVSITLFTCIMIASFVDMKQWIRIIIIIAGILQFIIGMFYGLRIEQIAGYYECNNCHHKYVPTYKSVFLAMHVNRTRYLKCPKCGKRTWSKKKVL
ncbi:MAG: helix-turn-helix domain-containing protein [Bacilli bacterium]|nr:helix-turn-helix domain-containing protein [Bacilli bacterium]